MLVGKIIELDKPFAVIRKNVTDNWTSVEGEQKMGSTEEGMEVDTEDKKLVEPNYDIVGIIRWKIIFKNRPRPIITSSSSA